MYLHDDMIDMGLPEDQEWPDGTYRGVAIKIAINNPNVTSLDKMQEIIEIILNVPAEKIKTITYTELVDKYGMPDVEICW